LSSRTRPIGALAGICLVFAGLLLSSPSALAAGSRDLWPNGASGNRANTEWRTASYGGGALTRRTLIKAFMNAGEVVFLGSTAIGQGTSDILVYNPGRVTGPIGTETVPAAATANFSCNAVRVGAQGQITNRTQELTGPDTVPSSIANSYLPCVYPAPVTGVYDIAFLGPTGFAPSPDADGGISADVALAAAGDFSAGQGSSIAAWDATVRSSLVSPTNLTGRVFTYYLALFTGGNGRPVFPTVYAVTRDGFRYQVDLRGMDPNGWLIYGNQVGFYDADGTTPLYHDAVAVNSGSPGQLTSIQGGVTIALPSFPLFFEPPAVATITALGIPTTTTAPTISSLSFAGNQGGNTSLVNTGGTFSYTSNVSGVYNIVISLDGLNFDPTLPANRSLRGVRGAGNQTVPWDGNSNSGAAFPAGTYKIRGSVHAGEYHFPMIDVENDTQGGPVVTLLNAPGGTCPALTGACKSAFYDDRAYRTSNGTLVNSGNAVGSVLCGLNPPATALADPVAGFDSSTTQRAFGANPGSNTNAPCTGSFGDAKGLDLWTYYPSNTPGATLTLVDAAADIGLAKTVSDANPAVGTNVTFTVTATNHGPNDASAVQVTDLLPAGLTYVSSLPSQGTYAPGTGIWNIGLLATGLSVTLRLTVTVTGTTAVTNIATRTATTPGDFDPANDSASATVTGTATPGLPGDSVPPLAGLLLGLLPLIALFVFAAVAARRRRQVT
jgi:uncharacterized repeat protein (TIGR01451 family)